MIDVDDIVEYEELGEYSVQMIDEIVAVDGRIITDCATVVDVKTESSVQLLKTITCHQRSNEVMSMIVPPVHVNARETMNAHVNVNGYECREFIDVGVDVVVMC
jgi:hypothetical protein